MDGVIRKIELLKRGGNQGIIFHATPLRKVHFDMIVTHLQSSVRVGPYLKLMYVEGRVSTRKVPTLHHVVCIVQNDILTFYKSAVIHVASMVLAAVDKVRFLLIKYWVEVVRVPKVTRVCKLMTVPYQVLR